MNLLRAPWVWAMLAVPLAAAAVLTPDGSLLGVLLGALTALTLVVAVTLLAWPSATIRRVLVGALVLAGGVWAGGLAGERMRHWLQNHEGLGVLAALALIAAMLIVPFVALPLTPSAAAAQPAPDAAQRTQPRPSTL